MRPPQGNPRSGLAMMAVLLVLMALFVLSAPFLVTLRNADQASAESADRALLRVTLDAQARHAAAVLAGSHPAVDTTPWYDDEAELAVEARFPDGFLPTQDPRAPMWGIAAEDVAGRVDLGSASPHVLANLIGGAARLGATCTEKDAEIELTGTDGFLPAGFVFVDDEAMAYEELGTGTLKRLARGLLVREVDDGKTASCGPSKAVGHEVGAYVIDQRAWALCEWRISPRVSDDVRVYAGIEQLLEAQDLVLAEELGREAYLALERTTSPHGDVRAGARWQRPARVVAPPTGEPQYGCRLTVDDVRWFNPGTTVRVTDGRSTELALVRRTEGRTLILMEPLQQRFEELATVVAPLARRPVNVNTASPEVLRALWTNLKLRGKSARITSGEAEQLVELALESRPFTGFEDFLRRLVLPAGGLDALPSDAPVEPEALAGSDDAPAAALIDADDAVALYKNALNANDNELEFSTMPLCFTSRDVYELELRAAVNAPSGVERARGVRELTEVMVPQKDLLQVWTRQEELDEAPRLDEDSAGWMTGPVPTSRHDPAYGEASSLRWPSRARAHLGPFDTQPSLDPLGDTTPVYSFADREEDIGWVQLAPSREEDGARQPTWALHFDDETRTLEGRYLPDGPAPLDLAKLGWAGGATPGSLGSLMQGMAFSTWVKPQDLEEGALLLDVGGPFKDADRLSLVFEGGNLVLRVLDGAGDNPLTTFQERSEVRFPMNEGPGLPRDTWSHVLVGVDGNRPDQMVLAVDGRRSAHTPGLTRLSAALSDASDTIQVESTEGFPDRCVLRIGEELIEAIKLSDRTFRARFESVGQNAGFGGRIAREYFQGANPEANMGLFKDTSHPAGTTVQLYGYSLPLYSNVPNAASNLASELGMFAVARVTGVVLDGSERTGSGMEPITVNGQLFTFDVGHGIDGVGDELDGLLLQPADPNRSLEETMQAFSEEGGYAAILGIAWRNGNNGQAVDINGTRLGGVEVVRYSGWSGQTLNITARGGAGLKRLQGSHPDVEGRAGFIISYGTGQTLDTAWLEHDNELSYQVMVIPISLPVRGTAGVTGFEERADSSSFAQITHSGGDSHLTEWVRYDEIAPEGFFVRSNANALLAANAAAHAGFDSGTEPPPPPTNPNSVMPAGAASTAAPLVAPPAPPPPRPARPRASQGGNSYWFYAMGEREDDDFAVARAVNSQFQFRGVMGTYCHPHPSGTLVLPVFRTRNLDETAGLPGRFDAVTFLSPEPGEPGFPAVVQHAHRPFEYLAYSWQDAGPLTPAPVEEAAVFSQSGFDISLTHVALDDRLSVPFAAVPVGDAENPVDSRLLSRMTLFPSGELPRRVQNGQMGGDARDGGKVPSAVVDEALFFPSRFTSISGMPGQLVLSRALTESDATFEAAKDVVRTTLGDVAYKIAALAPLPKQGGLLRIGDEILCYQAYDENTFTFTLAPGGRGLLGTEVQPHRIGEGVTYLGALPVAVLGANIGADDAFLPLLEAPAGFPSQGLVRIDDELVHYTRVDGQILEMPRASARPGEMDRKGPGLFRGRFGTDRAAHTAGAAVVLHPFRYWDRWSDLADAPELTYYALGADQPDAYWKRVFWKTEGPAFPGPELGVLQRTRQETPWDSPPDTPGLALYREGKLDGGGNPVEVQSDRVEWRVFVRHLPGSFDPVEGLAHGWKTTPRLELFGVEYLAPARTLERMDR